MFLFGVCLRLSHRVAFRAQVEKRESKYVSIPHSHAKCVFVCAYRFAA